MCLVVVPGKIGVWPPRAVAEPNGRRCPMDTRRTVRLVHADAGSGPVHQRRTAMRSPRSTFAMIAVAALASVFALSMFGGSVGAEKISSRDAGAKVDPEGCPPGWEQATHPLNPQLGCLPTREK